MRTYIHSLALGSMLMTMALHAAPAPKGGAAKAPEGAPAPQAPAIVGGFTLDTGLDIPAARVGAKKGEGETYPFGAMAVGQSFLLPVAVPTTITDEAEKTKAFKEESRKLSNRISGAIRRHRKANALQNFAIRTVNDPAGKLGVGVRVWREADATPPAVQPSA